jgi:hypothetical protein
MNSDSDDEFQTPENALYEGGGVPVEHINNIEHIYIEFKKILDINKKQQYNTYIINTKFQPSELKPIYNYIEQLNKDRKEFINALNNNGAMPAFSVEFYNKYKDIIDTNDILQMLLIDAIEVSYHCYPYSQNNETLTMD